MHTARHCHLDRLDLDLDLVEVLSPDASIRVDVTEKGEENVDLLDVDVVMIYKEKNGNFKSRRPIANVEVIDVEISGFYCIDCC